MLRLNSRVVVEVLRSRKDNFSGTKRDTFPVRTIGNAGINEGKSVLLNQSKAGVLSQVPEGLYDLARSGPFDHFLSRGTTTMA